MGDHADSALQDHIAKWERDAMVLEHMSLVEHIAWGIYLKLPGNILLEDLVHSGVVGLLDAIDKYDPLRNVPFPVYASFRIRGEIRGAVLQVDGGRALDEARIRRLKGCGSHMACWIARLPRHHIGLG